MLRCTYEEIAGMIDHSLVNPVLTAQQLEEGCALAMQYSVATVSIMPWYLRRAAERLSGSGVGAGTTVGFPHGSHATAAKVAEAKHALGEGAQEIDMVANVSAVRSGWWDHVRADIGAVCEVVHDAGAKLKVILENCYLSDAEKIGLCEICGEVRVDWVKTSTGYASGGCTWEDLVLMRRHSPSWVQVKAAGGIRDFESLLRVRELGATRCGATKTAEMLDECRRRLALPPIRTISRTSSVAGDY